MLKAIFYKEWLKLRLFWCLALAVHAGLLRTDVAVVASPNINDD